MRSFHRFPRYVYVLVLFVLVAATATSALAAPASTIHRPGYGAWGRGTLTDNEIKALIGQMTIAEETALVHGGSDSTCATSPVGCVGQAGIVVGVPRLGIPPLRMTDGPAGVRLSHEATAMPAPVGLAATFDRDTAGKFGKVMGSEGRALNQDVLLAPMINQVGVPTAGRNFETLGEDPFLAGELVASEIKGIQAEGLIATAKHYAMNDFENGRNSTSVTINEQALREMELQAFDRAVDVDVGAVMCAYNRVNDIYACSNDELQNKILRDAFGFAGFIMSDWGATHRISDLINGLDIQMPSGNIMSDSALANAVISGTAEVALTNDLPAVPAYTAQSWKQALDTAAFRILVAMNKAGLLEGTQYGSHYTDGTPYVPTRPDLLQLKAGSFAIAQQIAEDGATLLKNDGGTLPLSKDLFKPGGRNKGVAIMGPTSVTPYVGGGGSANVTPYDGITSPYEALIKAAGHGAKLTYVPGYDLDGQLMPATAVTAPANSAFAGQNGWLRTQISTTVPASGAAPEACSGTCAPDRLDPTIDYYGNGSLPASTAWRWQSSFSAPAAGAWQLKIFVKNQSSAQLFVDGLATAQRRINMGAYGVGGGFGGSSISNWDKLTQTAKSHSLAIPRFQQATWSVTLATGEAHSLDLRAYANSTDALGVRFLWVPLDWQAQKIAEAVAAAKASSQVLLFAYDEGTEGSDRGGNNQATGLKLPGYQDDLIAAVVAANPNTIVVLNTGDPVLMPWAPKVKAILEMWYPGQMGGVATADVLLGKANPSGKLPVTFPADPTAIPTYSASCDPTVITSNPPNDGNCPLYPGVYKPGFISGNHSYKTIDFVSNGIFVGYRWFDKHNIKPLFPFGHGLSYTRFEYADLHVDTARDGAMTVRFRVRNAGSVAGAEVPQIYLGASGNIPADTQMAAQALVGFERIELAPRQSKLVSIRIDPRQVSYWSAQQHRWVLAGGPRTVAVGASSRDIRLKTKVFIGH